MPCSLAALVTERLAIVYIVFKAALPVSTAGLRVTFGGFSLFCSGGLVPATQGDNCDVGLILEIFSLPMGRN